MTRASFAWLHRCAAAAFSCLGPNPLLLVSLHALSLSIMFARAARRVLTPATARAARSFSAEPTAALMTEPTLKDVLTEQVPVKQAAMKELKAKYGDKSLGEVTVDQCIGGARGVKCMLWETSLLDTMEGIRFRGYTIPELQQKLPTYAGPGGEGEPIPEALIW